MTSDETPRAQLEETMERQAAILDATTDFVGHADPQGRVIFINRAGRDLLGIPREEDVTGHFIARCHPPAAMKLIETEVLPTAIRDGSWRGETSLLTRDGREIPVSAVVLSHRDAAGQVRFVSAVMRDLSEQKQAEADRDRFFNNSLSLLCVADMSGYFHRLNPAWERLLGYTQEELCSQPFLDFIHPDDREPTLTEMEKLGHGVDVVSFENRYRCRDGSYRWLEWSCPAPAPGESTLFASARDVTKRKQAEELAKAAENERKARLAARPFKSVRGQVDYPVQGQLVRRFGDRDGFGNPSKGILIATRRLGQVTAPVSGKVEYAGEFRSYGILLILDVGQGYHVLMAGLDQLTAETGQIVEAGEPIGRMGTSSARGTLIGELLDSDKPVLYVEFRTNGRAVDSSSWWIGNRKEARR